MAFDFAFVELKKLTTEREVREYLQQYVDSKGLDSDEFVGTMIDGEELQDLPAGTWTTTKVPFFSELRGSSVAVGTYSALTNEKGEFIMDARVYGNIVG